LLVAAADCPSVPSQESSQNKTNDSTAQATTATTDTRGSTDGQTYKNAFLGVEFTLPEDLEFGEQPQVQIEPATGWRQFSIRANSKPGNRFSFHKYIVDKALMFVADPLARHSVDERTDTGYMRRMVQVEKSEGFKLTGDNLVDKIGDATFSRANFAKGKRQHVVFVALRKDYAIVFIFVANDLATAEALAKSTIVRLPQ
jgi:hypothetical protein